MIQLLRMNKKIVIIVLTIICLYSGYYLYSNHLEKKEVNFWDFRSVDTMKYSRDVAREKLTDKSFDYVIEQQAQEIAKTGATHIAIATPYDEEFLPYLKRWVVAARNNKLKVWFRGNWSGWEGWFGYPKIDRKTHIEKTREFILSHSDLFENGDVFSACPECENGGPGDPRQNGDTVGHRKFLLDEYAVTKAAFAKIHKKVPSNFASMNGDVARLIMDKQTTAGMDGIVVIDHYVATPEKLARDIQDFAKQSHGKVILGEFGAPIPDIHGNMTEAQQAAWLEATFEQIAPLDELVGVSYWVNTGGSTQLWGSDGNPRQAVVVLTRAYTPYQIYGVVRNGLRYPIANADVTNGLRRAYTAKDGSFALPSLEKEQSVDVQADEYYKAKKVLNSGALQKITMDKQKEDPFFIIGRYILAIIPLP